MVVSSTVYLFLVLEYPRNSVHKDPTFPGRNMKNYPPHVLTSSVFGSKFEVKILCIKDTLNPFY